MSIQTYLRIIITLAFLAMLSACGSSSTAGTEDLDLGSNGIVTKPIVTCNKSTNATWGYRVAAQVSGTGFDPNWANLYLSGVPAGFEAGTTYVQFFKGQAVNDTSINFSTTAVPFGLYDRQAGQYLNNGQLYNSLVWNEVKNLISGATPATFISRVLIVLSLQDPQALYQVLSVGSYNVSNNAGVEGLSVLLPTFHANPADYAVKSNGQARETVLRNLHPLRNQTSGDFQSMAQALCQ